MIGNNKGIGSLGISKEEHGAKMYTKKHLGVDAIILSDLELCPPVLRIWPVSRRDTDSEGQTVSTSRLRSLGMVKLITRGESDIQNESDTESICKVGSSPPHLDTVLICQIGSPFSYQDHHRLERKDCHSESLTFRTVKRVPVFLLSGWLSGKISSLSLVIFLKLS